MAQQQSTWKQKWDSFLTHFVWILPIIYIIINLFIMRASFIIPLKLVDPLSTKHQTLITEFKDFITSIASLNISIGIGLIALIVAIAALATKRVDNTIPLKKELVSVLRTSIYFIFANLILFSLSYSTFLIGNYSLLVFYFVLNITFVLVVSPIFKLIKAVLNL